ncbi:hypothetical protein [Halomonas elongata]|uniref:hypothetical protein n=1 Tax=Halomonas elongata TaxID=2746 RepID=UPI00186BA190|nr:hypothetical protein [Halomonas elongata]MBW5801167.1 hypothetical protein [Halomonas elongata]
MKGDPLNLLAAYTSAVVLGLASWQAWEAFSAGSVIAPFMVTLVVLLGPVQVTFIAYLIRAYFKGWEQ